MSVPANLDTSLSAPAGDPTLKFPDRPVPRTSRLSPCRSIVKPPLPSQPLVSDEPLVPLGLGSPTTPDASSKTGPSGQKLGTGSSLGDQYDSPPAQNEVKPDAWGECGPSSSQAVCSHLTADLQAARLQEEERRASNAEAGSSSSSPAKPAAATGAIRGDGVLSALSGSISGNKPHCDSTTPFELASRRLLKEQQPGKSEGAPNLQGLSLHEAGGSGPQHAKQAQHAHHGRQEEYPIGDSSSKAEDRLRHALQPIRCSQKASALCSPIPS